MITDEQAVKYIAKNLRLRLSELEMSQGELARQSHSSAVRISQYARGAVMPGSGVLSRIAEALGTTVDGLLSKPAK